MLTEEDTGITKQGAGQGRQGVLKKNTECRIQNILATNGYAAVVSTGFWLLNSIQINHYPLTNDK
jgi:hypothetical protein